MARAVTELLKKLDCYQAQMPVEDLEGTALSPVDPAEVADLLAYAMRFDERAKARRTGLKQSRGRSGCTTQMQAL